ncbi:RING-box protein 1A-like [Teleopsis dalmanni]|uniref:RING-box protein 1A-like n=1 Tax=Teleopsis dalmanni TaxID=139649 RepID=UPI0018CE4391|nr:RING-box protein 1A-like [Teleopsis dalmanni]
MSRNVEEYQVSSSSNKNRDTVAEEALSSDDNPTCSSKSANEYLSCKKWDNSSTCCANKPEGKCAICRNLLSDLCNECQAQMVTIDDYKCFVVWGKCNHAFHWHCILPWLEKNSICPVDQQEWQTKKVSNASDKL